MKITSCLNICRRLSLGAVFLALLLCARANAQTVDAPSTSTLTPEQQKQADQFDAATQLLTKETALVNAQTALRNAKVTSEVPTTGASVTPLSGTVTGANNLTFAMYIASIDSLRAIAQKICNDFRASNIVTVYITNRNVAEVVAKDEALRKFRDQLADRLTTATAEAKRLADMTSGTETKKISPASLAAIAAGIDVADGLIKGVAGLASLFKTERKIEAQDNLLGVNEIAGALALCQATPVQPPAVPDAGPPNIIDADGDLVTLVAKVDVINNETRDISNKADALQKAIDDLADARAKLEQEISTAIEAKDATKVKALKGRIPHEVDTFQKQASDLYASAQQFLDSVYKVDSATGVSPVLVAAQFRVLRERATDVNGHRLLLTSLKSSGYSLTTKSLFFDDKVAYAGGVALRVSVVQPNGTAAYDRIFYRQSGWIRADFHGEAELARQNF